MYKVTVWVHWLSINEQTAHAFERRSFRTAIGTFNYEKSLLLGLARYKSISAIVTLIDKAGNVKKQFIH
ncbi:MAG: hypothetical protein EOO16_13215 [Chitinophagaceae bacterium]|nr:MAG: hypothetical protein EOO16_13215 [Chitinophagaceae bacterium]